MKLFCKLILLLTVSFLCPNISSAQTLKDFNDKCTYKITYDDCFNPTLHLTIKNVSAKTISSVEVTIYYSDNTQDIFAPEEKKIVRVQILPYQTLTVNMCYNREQGYCKASKFWISGVRFSDGSIVDR